MEVADRPTLASKSAAYDRFGFAIETPGNTLEEKAEFLRKQAENNQDQLDDEAQHVKKVFSICPHDQPYLTITESFI